MKHGIQFLQEIGSNLQIHLFLFFLGAFFTSLFLIPKIRAIAYKLKIQDLPNIRSSHSVPVPTFGGIAFYISYIFALFFLQFFYENEVSLTLLASISILFFTGFLDDIVTITAKSKFLGQFIGVAVLMFHPDFRILTLHGFMGVYEIPLVVSVGGSLFFLLGVVNAFNLLDGIDGLTATTGIIVASFYSFMFYQLGYAYYLCLCITTIATLLAFLRFNLSNKRKIFMGDTGSLAIGLVLGALTLKLMSSGNLGAIALNFDRKQLPLLLLGVLFVPILDTCRVMLIRFSKGVSIFQPDRNHIHHIMIDYGLSHRRASFYIGVVNLSVALSMFYVIVNFNILASVFILASIFMMSITVLFFMNKNKSAVKLKIRMKQLMMRIFFY